MWMGITVGIFVLFLAIFLIFYLWDLLTKIKRNQEIIMQHLGINPDSNKNDNDD